MNKEKEQISEIKDKSGNDITNKETEIENTRAKKNRLIYKDYRKAIAKCKTNATMLAWFPTFDKNAKHTLVFPREDGKTIKLRADHFRAAFRDTSNRINKSGIVATKWMDFFPTKLELNGNKVGTYIKPVLAQRTGSGMNRYESLPTGIEFEMKMKYPSSVLSQKDMKEWIETVGIKGMGAVRQGEFGTFDVLEVKFK